MSMKDTTGICNTCWTVHWPGHFRTETLECHNCDGEFGEYVPLGALVEEQNKHAWTIHVQLHGAAVEIEELKAENARLLRALSKYRHKMPF